MASQAMKFTYDIDRLILNADLAKVDVWERGFFSRLRRRKPMSAVSMRCSCYRR